MPTQQQVQDTILSAEYFAATLTDANLAKMQVGNTNVSWDEVRKLTRNIQALQIQFDLQTYTDWTIYDCLNSLIGFDTNVNSLDPNYQIPDGSIVIVNPATYLQPVVLGWSDFSVDGSPDAGTTRVTYYNSNWAGVNPFMALTSPGLTGLEYGTDYVLIQSGGFTLLDTGNVPGIVDGQLLTVYSYALA